MGRAFFISRISALTTCTRLWGLALLVFAAGPALAQDSNAPPPPTKTSPASDAKPKTKPAPKDVPDAPAPAPTPQSLPADQIAPPAKKHSAAQDNPFPEDISKKAAGTAPDAPAPNAPPPGTQPLDSSSLSGADKLDLTGDKDKNSGRQKLTLTDPDSGRPYDPKLAADDDRIGQFYLQSGNYPGAYARFKEATAANPGDAAAVFGLAEAAHKLKHEQEAVDNYIIYLDANPDGPKAKAARKALSELNAAKKP